MITPISVKYDVAKILSSKHHDIIVYDAFSGAVCEFTEIEWPHMGIMKDAGRIVGKLGIGCIDNAYIFVWMKID